ncbi:MAG: amino acid ABC transporter substrate-binding protein [Ruminococcaceae bacterium]|nr:amino acid ABC transporter substrate-binding protein [Oscillospiraceae bacterium]
MKKRILSALLAAAMILGGALALTACGGDSNKLIMATNASFPPYEYKDGENFAGIDIEIAGKIAEKLGKTLEIKDVEFGSIIGGVQTGKFDMGMAGMTVTEERLQSVNFTSSYATGIQSVIVADKSSYKSIDDFFNLDKDGNWVSVKDGVKIGVQQDTTGDIYASDTVENWGFGENNVIRYKTGNEAVLALTSGKITAVIIDNEPAKSYVASTAGLRILDGAYTEEQYAICIAKENTALLEQVNKALEELIADGTVKAIIDKYIPAN